MDVTNLNPQKFSVCKRRRNIQAAFAWLALLAGAAGFSLAIFTEYTPEFLILIAALFLMSLLLFRSVRKKSRVLKSYRDFYSFFKGRAKSSLSELAAQLSRPEAEVREMFLALLEKGYYQSITFHPLSGRIEFPNAAPVSRPRPSRPRPQKQEPPPEPDLSAVDRMSGAEFEQFCAELLRKSGFLNVTVSGRSGDQGVDIVAENRYGTRYAIQCKHYSNPLGNKSVQEVSTGKQFYHCHVGAVMTNSTFTKGAVELAKATGILLWDRSFLLNMIQETIRK